MRSEAYQLLSGVYRQATHWSHMRRVFSLIASRNGRDFCTVCGALVLDVRGIVAEQSCSRRASLFNVNALYPGPTVGASDDLVEHRPN